MYICYKKSGIKENDLVSARVEDLWRNLNEKAVETINEFKCYSGKLGY